MQRTAKKCTQIYNARAQPLFYSLDLLFGDVLVAVVVLVCLNSLIISEVISIILVLDLLKLVIIIIIVSKVTTY